MKSFLMFSVLLLFSTPSPLAQGEVATAKIFDEIPPPGTLTTIQKEERWKRYEGRCVEWEATVIDVIKEQGEIAVILFYRLDLNIILTLPVARYEYALTLTKGTKYTFKGTLRRYLEKDRTIFMDEGCQP